MCIGTCLCWLRLMPSYKDVSWKKLQQTFLCKETIRTNLKSPESNWWYGLVAMVSDCFTVVVAGWTFLRSQFSSKIVSSYGFFVSNYISSTQKLIKMFNKNMLSHHWVPSIRNFSERFCFVNEEYIRSQSYTIIFFLKRLNYS